MKIYKICIFLIIAIFACQIPHPDPDDNPLMKPRTNPVDPHADDEYIGVYSDNSDDDDLSDYEDNYPVQFPKGLQRNFTYTYNNILQMEKNRRQCAFQWAQKKKGAVDYYTILLSADKNFNPDIITHDDQTGDTFTLITVETPINLSRKQTNGKYPVSLRPISNIILNNNYLQSNVDYYWYIKATKGNDPGAFIKKEVRQFRYELPASLFTNTSSINTERFITNNTSYSLSWETDKDTYGALIKIYYDNNASTPIFSKTITTGPRGTRRYDTDIDLPIACTENNYTAKIHYLTKPYIWTAENSNGDFTYSIVEGKIALIRREIYLDTPSLTWINTDGVTNPQFTVTLFEKGINAPGTQLFAKKLSHADFIDDTGSTYIFDEETGHYTWNVPISDATYDVTKEYYYTVEIENGLHGSKRDLTRSTIDYNNAKYFRILNGNIGLQIDGKTATSEKYHVKRGRKVPIRMNPTINSNIDDNEFEWEVHVQQGDTWNEGATPLRSWEHLPRRQDICDVSADVTGNLVLKGNAVIENNEYIGSPVSGEDDAINNDTIEHGDLSNTVRLEQHDPTTILKEDRTILKGIKSEDIVFEWQSISEYYTKTAFEIGDTPSSERTSYTNPYFSRGDLTDRTITGLTNLSNSDTGTSYYFHAKTCVGDKNDGNDYLLSNDDVDWGEWSENGQLTLYSAKITDLESRGGFSQKFSFKSAGKHNDGIEKFILTIRGDGAPEPIEIDNTNDGVVDGYLPGDFYIPGNTPVTYTWSVKGIVYFDEAKTIPLEGDPYPTTGGVFTLYNGRVDNLRGSVNTVTYISNDEILYNPAQTITVMWDKNGGAQQYSLELQKNTTPLQFYQNKTSQATFPATTYTLADLTCSPDGNTYTARIQAVDSLDIEGPWSNTAKGGGQELVYNVVKSTIGLKNPVHNAKIIKSAVNLSWNTINGADDYRVNVTGGKSLSLTANSGTQNITDLNTSGPGTAYSWNVTASNKYGLGTTSSSRTFSLYTGNIATITGTVNSTSYSNGDSILNNSANIYKVAWASAGDPVFTYDLEHAAASGFSNASVEYPAVTALEQSVGYLPVGNHYYRVRAKDAYGNYGPYKQNVHFNIVSSAVSGRSPLNNSKYILAAKELTWNTVTGANQYDVTINGATTEDLTETKATVSGNSNNGTSYQWSVTPENGLGKGNQSSNYTVTLYTGNIADFDLTINGVEYTNGDEVFMNTANSFVFDWPDTNGADSYSFITSTTADFSSSNTVESITESKKQFTGSNFPAGNYYFKVKALDTYDNSGDYSSVIHLFVSERTTANLLPAAGSGFITTTGDRTLDWDAVVGTPEISYVLTVDGTESIITSNTHALSGLTRSNNGTIHNWNIKLKNKYGRCSAAKSANFTLYTGNVLKFNAIVNNENYYSNDEVLYNSGNTFRLEWESVIGAASYILEQKIGTGDFEQIYSGSSTSQALSNGLAADTYQYRLKAKDATNNEGNYSSIITITIISSTVTLIEPIHNIALISSEPVLSWTKAGNDTTYALTITGGNASSQSVNGTSITLNNLSTADNGIPYSWNITPTNRYGDGQTTALRSFTLYSGSIETFNGVVNNNAYTNGDPILENSISNTCKLTWTHAGHTSFTFTIESDDTVSFTSPSTEYINISGTEQVLGNLEKNNHYYRITAKDIKGNTGPVKSAVYFNVDSSAITNRVPENNTGFILPSKTVSWDPVSGANRYNVTINSLVTADHSDTSITISGDSDTGSSHTWSVAPKNDLGTGNTSSTYTITLYNGRITGFEVSVNGVQYTESDEIFENAANTVAIDWDDIPGANSYELIISSTPDFSSGNMILTPTLSTVSFNGNELTAGNYYVKVAALDEYGNKGDYSNGYHIKVVDKTTANLIPISGSRFISTTGDRTISWDSAAGTPTISYIVTLNGFEHSTPSSNSETLSTLTRTDGGTMHSWDITLKNKYGQSSSSVFSNFTLYTGNVTGFDAVVNGKPYSSNEEVLYNAGNTFRLEWDSVAGAASYILEENINNAGFSAVTPGPGTQTSWNLDDGLSPGTYEYRLTAVDSNNNQGNPSSSIVITVISSAVTLSGPADTKKLIRTKPELSWTKAGNDTTYALSITGGNATSQSVSATSITLNGLTAANSGTSYTWSITPTNFYGNGQTTTSRTFTLYSGIIPLINGYLNNTDYINGSPVLEHATDNTFKITWSQAGDAEFTYEIQYADNAFFNTPSVYTDLATLEKELGNLSTGDYFYRVRAKDTDNNYGEYTDYINFTVVNSTVTLAYPYNNEKIIAQDTWLGWSSVVHTTNYELDVNGTKYTGITDTSKYFSELPRSVTGTSYTWSITPKNAISTGNTCTPFTFIIYDAIPDTLTTNTDDISNIRLSWSDQSAKGAEKYQIEIRKGTTYYTLTGGLWADYGTEVVSSNSIDSIDGTLFESGTYIWRVSAGDASYGDGEGGWSSWSAESSFTIP